MSYAIPGIYEEAPALEYEPVRGDLIFVPRSKNQWIPFLVPLALCAFSWLGGGIPFLTDAGFTIFTLLCLAFVTIEFIRFPRRFGIGGLVLWGGTLCWFCQDYFAHWFNAEFSGGILTMKNTGEGARAWSAVMPAWVIAKAAFLHVLFVMAMSLSLNWNIGTWLEKLILIVPNPVDNRFYMMIMLTLFCFSLCPYLVFNAEPWYLCIYHALFAGWTGPPQLFVFRTGNLNYSWGGYVAQIMQVGEVGGIVAIIYTILIARSWTSRMVGIFIWTFNAMIAFETGRRGEISFSLLPPIAALFIKYQAQAAEAFKKYSKKAYIVCGLLTVCLLWIVQFQGTFRSNQGGYGTADLAQLDLTKSQGNTMFSEGLKAYAQVGETLPYFYSQDFPGEGAILAVPHTVFDFVIGFIPRALWPNKPVDALWAWYNREYTGAGNGVEGTTIAHGLVGSWYFKYGLAGMIEGALLVGWLMGTSERALQHSKGEPIGILMSLGVAVWIFRTYRDFIFIDLYGLILGLITLYIIVRIFNGFLGSAPQQASL
jgi:hypothetical protein